MRRMHFQKSEARNEKIVRMQLHAIFSGSKVLFIVL